jgi:hypothetical protein
MDTVLTPPDPRSDHSVILGSGSDGLFIFARYLTGLVRIDVTSTSLEAQLS